MLFGKKCTQYSATVRAFAFTLHSYSPRSYGFVRSKFNNHLPDPSCIRSWVSNITEQCEPGICPEALRAIKMIADDMAQKDKKFICSLAWDEMNIKRHINWNEAKNKFVGFISYGRNDVNGELPVASQALVFLLTGINVNISIPVAHFFIKGLLAEEKAALINKIIIEITQAGGFLINVTFDGYANNFAACRILGASFKLSDLRPYFLNPIDDTKIHITCDACHMIKLVRNCLASEKRISDGTGELIEWRYFLNLENCRINDHFVTHKMTKKHTQWFRNKMNVKLAVQVLSNSVSKSMKYLAEHNFKRFQNSEATSKFSKIFNDVFDIFNSKKPGSKNIFKNPICVASASTIFAALNETSEYIAKLELHGKNILKSGKRTGKHFLHLLVNLFTL